MIERLKRAWTHRTELERWLIVFLAAGFILLLLVLGAWREQVIPWATAWGSVAEWFGAGATAGGFVAAIITLRFNALEQKTRAEAAQRAEAARVAIDWNDDVLHMVNNFPGKSFETFRYRGEVHNAGSSPINHLILWLDGIDGAIYKDNGEARPPGDVPRTFIDTVVPGGRKKFSFDIAWNDPTIDGMTEGYRVRRAASFVFTDVRDNNWRNEQGDLTKTSEELANDYKVSRKLERNSTSG